MPVDGRASTTVSFNRQDGSMCLSINRLAVPHQQQWKQKQRYVIQTHAGVGVPGLPCCCFCGGPQEKGSVAAAPGAATLQAKETHVPLFPQLLPFQVLLWQRVRESPAAAGSTGPADANTTACCSRATSCAGWLCVFAYCMIP